MGMMHGLEVRSPFLDHQLAEFVYNLPVEFKMNKNENKIILKDILSEIMPREFVHRRKQGFGAPVKEWLRTPEMKRLVEKEFGNEAYVYKFFDRKAVEKIISRFYGNASPNNSIDESVYYKIWVLLCLELWLKTHLN